MTGQKYLLTGHFYLITPKTIKENQKKENYKEGKCVSKPIVLFGICDQSKTDFDRDKMIYFDRKHFVRYFEL